MTLPLSLQSFARKARGKPGLKIIEVSIPHELSVPRHEQPAYPPDKAEVDNTNGCFWRIVPVGGLEIRGLLSHLQ